ncbi:MAG TPA: universal stress protein [Ramlibacter sp.]|nr:universal stress protein [Ramlibacter sp.]
MKECLTQLLVHLDATAHASRRLAVARAIAHGQGAALTALYAVTPALVEIPFAPDAGPNVAQVLCELDDERRANVRAGFDRANLEGLHAAWAEVRDYPVMPAFARQALYADLLVLGQHDGSDPAATGVPADFVESVLAESGKPALVLPYTQASASLGEIVVVAWKPTREAARAISAAVPLLQRAQRVHVVSWSRDEADVIEGNGLDLDGYLKLRGIEPVWHREGGGEPDRLGDLLLSRAADLDADLLVMGCYGHSRAREWVLGGTSRTILQSMTLPVLMAH